MKFARIELLFLIWIIPLLMLAYLYGRRKRRRILRAFAKPRMLANIVPADMNSRRRWGTILVLSAAVCAIFAMAGPQYGFHWQKIERRGIDIIIALDCSRSMLATDIQPTRLDRAKREIYDLLAMLQGDRVGLVAFSGTAFLQCPLTIDYPAFNLFLDVLTPSYLPVGGSDLTAALQNAQEAFDPQSNADKAVILITDGEDTGDGDPNAAAQAAQKAGIKLFTIGVGSNDGVPVPESQGGFKKDPAGRIILSRLDESLLTRMALTTGGSYVRSVAGDMDLENIYVDQIRAGMNAATIESGRKQVWADRYQWPLTLAVMLLFLVQWIGKAVKRPANLFLLSVIISAYCPVAQAGPLQEGYDAYQKENYETALKKFIDGQLQDPDNPDVLYNIGNAYYKKGDYKAANEHYRQALPKASPELKPDLLYNLGNSAFRQGALKEAVEHYEAALNQRPEDPQTKENLAFVKQQMKKQKQQQNKPQDNDQQQKNEKDPSQDQKKENRKPDSKKQPPKQDKGSQADKPQQKEKPPEDNPKPGQDQQQMNDPAKNDQQAQAPKQPDKGKKPPNQGTHQKEGRKDSSAASQMLNRLKDQPGKAMMPEYEKHSVEKDW